MKYLYTKAIKTQLLKLSLRGFGIILFRKIFITFCLKLTGSADIALNLSLGFHPFFLRIMYPIRHYDHSKEGFCCYIGPIKKIH